MVLNSTLETVRSVNDSSRACSSLLHHSRRLLDRQTSGTCRGQRDQNVDAAGSPPVPTFLSRSRTLLATVSSEFILSQRRPANCAVTRADLLPKFWKQDGWPVRSMKNHIQGWESQDYYPPCVTTRDAGRLRRSLNTFVKLYPQNRGKLPNTGVPVVCCKLLFCIWLHPY